MTDLENRGQEFCKEHARVLHQIEHINWHLEGCTRHRPCLGRLPENCPKKSNAPSSCISSSAPTCARPSVLVSRQWTFIALKISIHFIHINSFTHSFDHFHSNSFLPNCFFVTCIVTSPRNSHHNRRIFFVRQIWRIHRSA